MKHRRHIHKRRQLETREAYDAMRSCEAVDGATRRRTASARTKAVPADAVTRIGDFHVVCTCCGRTFEAAQWARLSDLGVQNYSDGIALELRNCPCGSTISSTLVDRYGHLAADLRELEESCA